MKPDQDQSLLLITDGFRRCDACMKKYSMLPDSVCDTCKVNPLKGEESIKSYILDALENPTTFGIEFQN